MDATTQPTTEAPAPLLPREELFCRAAARGDTLAGAARRAGYPPGSSRQRGSELWARDDIQARIGALMAEEETREQACTQWLRERESDLYNQCRHKGQFGNAARLLTFRYRLEKDARATRAPERAERERMREELRDELRAQIDAELRAGLVEAMRAELREGVREEVRAELRAEVEAEVQAQAAMEHSVTNHDAGADFSSATPQPAVRTRAAAPAAPGRTVTKRDELDEIEALPTPGRPASPQRFGDVNARLREIGRTMLAEQPSPRLRAALARLE